MIRMKNDNNKNDNDNNETTKLQDQYDVTV